MTQVHHRPNNLIKEPSKVTQKLKPKLLVVDHKIHYISDLILVLHRCGMRHHNQVCVSMQNSPNTTPIKLINLLQNKVQYGSIIKSFYDLLSHLFTKNRNLSITHASLNLLQPFHLVIKSLSLSLSLSLSRMHHLHIISSLYLRTIEPPQFQ
ncbi:hypothetical protein U1Q18_052420 [Sarracenia purpurea var. burkii]